MNIYNFEDKRVKLKSALAKDISPTRRVILICEFYDLLLETQEMNVIEAFYPDFLEELNQFLPEYQPYCMHSDISRKVINVISKIAQLESVGKLHLNFASKVIPIEEKINSLERILIGEKQFSREREPFFPSIENIPGYDYPVIGFIDSLNVKLMEAAVDTNIILIPAEKNPDKRINSQVNTCWELAMEYCSPFIKKNGFGYDVIVSFDKKPGVYTGESFGLALLAAFITKLLEIHNSSISVSVCPAVAMTGAYTAEGIIREMGKEIIEKETECVFYSGIETFVVPENDLGFAAARLKILNAYFPERNLNLIGAGNMWDLLDRRSIISIEKKNVFKRAVNLFGGR